MKFSIFNFQFSNFNRKLKKLLGSRRLQKIFLGLSVFLVVLFGAGYFLIARPGMKIYADVKLVRQQGKLLKDGFILQDLTKIERDFAGLDGLVTQIEENIKPLSWTKNLPFFGNYYKDVEHILRAAHRGVAAGSILIEAVEPFADVLGFKTEGTEAFLDAEKKIEGLVKVMPEVAPRLDEVAAEFAVIRQELETVDPSRYPVSFKGQPIRSLLADAKQTMNTVEESMPDVKELLTVLPGVLGDPTRKTYLILFQNDKELRSTGGFLTAYALMTIEGGKIIDVQSDDMYKLDGVIAEKVPPIPVLAQYLKVEEFFIRDSNLSPDFHENCQKFEWFLTKASGFPRIDGIIGIDTYLVRDILEVLGPVKLAGYEEEFSSGNVVYQLELYANLLGQYIVGRKDLLGVLMDAMMDKAFHAPRQQWKPLFEAGLKLAAEKHILLYLHDQRAQVLAEKYNYAGRLKEFEGDYLHVNDTNFAGAKANMYIQETVTQDYKVAKDGTVTKTVTIALNNPEPHDGWLNGTYYDWMRIYVPQGSKLLDSSAWREVRVSEDLGKTVFETYTYCYPENSNSVSVTYELPFKIQKGQALQTLVQKQPGTDGHLYKVTVDGKKVEEFELKADREINVQL